MAPYTGQNMGAGKLERIGKGVKAACLCGFGCSAFVYLLVVLFGRSLVCLFLDVPEETVIGYAALFLKTVASGYCLLTLVNVVRFSIQGMGFSVLAIVSGVMEMLARTFVGLFVAPRIGFPAVPMAHILAWVCADLFLIPAFFACRKRIAAQKHFSGGAE